MTEFGQSVTVKNEDQNTETVSVSDIPTESKTVLQYVAIAETEDETETNEQLRAKTEEEKHIKNLKRLLDAEFRQYINEKGKPETIRSRVAIKVNEMQAYIRDCKNEPSQEFLSILRAWKQNRITPILNCVEPAVLAETVLKKQKQLEVTENS